MSVRKKPEELRSHRWFGKDDMRSFGHHSRLSQIGYSRADYQGKPIIAIINTWSDINVCHAHFKQRAEEVKRGVLQAGGFPLEMPAIALAEVYQKPRRCCTEICWRWRPRNCCVRIRSTVRC
jgi:dihydroxy-acid dehydratase